MTGTKPDRWRLGVVSYLNARPLIEGLDADPDIELIFDVPARLPALLDAGAVDAALIPVIDLLRPDRRWRIISDACIGCDGETLTVRVFSRVQPQKVHRLHVDGDSHTSVALARVLWPELFGHAVETIPFAGFDSIHADEGVLLIGDKVVTHAPTTLEVETDLGSCWKSLTSLPFVFAAWAAPDDGSGDVASLAGRLSRARDAGVASADMIAADFGPGHGWPVTLAKRYLTSRLKFTLGPRQRLSLNRFLELVRRHELVASTQELVFA